jgi:hypothetical protein
MSPKSLNEDIHILTPPSVKRVSSSTLKRRSGVRLAVASSSSLGVEDTSSPTPPKTTNALRLSSDEVLSQSSECIQDAPAVLKSDTISDEEPTVTEGSDAREEGFTEHSASNSEMPSTIDSMSGNILDDIVAVPAERENEHQAQEGSSMNDDRCLFAEQTSSQQHKSEDTVHSTGASSDVLRIEPAIRPQEMHEERQFVQDADEEKETNEEAMNRHSNGLLASSANNDASKPSTSAVTAVQELPAHDNDGIPISKLDLEIDKVACLLATQAIKEALLEETAELFDAKPHKQATEAVSKKDVELPIAKSDNAKDNVSMTSKLTENAPNIATVKSSSDGQSIAKVAKIISAQAIETAVLNVDTEQAEITTNIPDAKLVNDGYNKPDNIVAKPTAETNEVTEMPSVKSNTEDQAVTESQGSNQKLIVRGKALTITKVSIYQCI